MREYSNQLIDDSAEQNTQNELSPEMQSLVDMADKMGEIREESNYETKKDEESSEEVRGEQQNAMVYLGGSAENNKKLMRRIAGMVEPNGDLDENDEYNKIRNGIYFTALLPYVCQEFQNADDLRKTTINNVINQTFKEIYESEKDGIDNLWNALDRQMYEYYDAWDRKEGDFGPIWLGTEEASVASGMQARLGKIEEGYEIDSISIKNIDEIEPPIGRYPSMMGIKNGHLIKKEKDFTDEWVEKSFGEINEKTSMDEMKIVCAIARDGSLSKYLSSILKEDNSNVCQHIKQDMIKITNEIQDSGIDDNLEYRMKNAMEALRKFQNYKEALDIYKKDYEEGKRIINNALIESQG